MFGTAHRSILACRDTLAAGFAERIAGCLPRDPLDHVNIAGLKGVRVRVRMCHPYLISTLDEAPLGTLHGEALGMAWRDGAWDLRVLRHPPLAGPQLGCVTSLTFSDFGLRDRLVHAAGRGHLVSWHWLPMRGGPPLRRKAHAAKDLTLDPEGGRAGPPPAMLPVPDWSRTGGSEQLIRLGTGKPAPVATPAAPRPGPRATGRQRGYIVALRHRLGRRGEPLPAALTRREASALIDALTRELGT